MCGLSRKVASDGSGLSRQVSLYDYKKLLYIAVKYVSSVNYMLCINVKTSLIQDDIYTIIIL